MKCQTLRKIFENVGKIFTQHAKLHNLNSAGDGLMVFFLKFPENWHEI